MLSGNDDIRVTFNEKTLKIFHRKGWNSALRRVARGGRGEQTWYTLDITVRSRVRTMLLHVYTGRQLTHGGGALTLIATSLQSPLGKGMTPCSVVSTPR